MANYFTVIPVPFGSGGGKEMLAHCKEFLEYDNEKPVLAINPRFTKLIASLRTCISSNDGKVNKEETSYDDIMDSFRLALKGIKMVKKENEIG